MYSNNIFPSRLFLNLLDFLPTLGTGQMASDVMYEVGKGKHVVTSCTLKIKTDVKNILLNRWYARNLHRICFFINKNRTIALVALYNDKRFVQITSRFDFVNDSVKSLVLSDFVYNWYCFDNMMFFSLRSKKRMCSYEASLQILVPYRRKEKRKTIMFLPQSAWLED